MTTTISMSRSKQMNRDRLDDDQEVGDAKYEMLD